MTTGPTLSRTTILVTGGCGYLGSRLVRHLAETAGDGVRIRIMDNLQRASTQALWNLPAGAELEFLEGDLLDPAGSDLAVRGVDAVVHLAGLVRSPFSFDDPSWLEQVNHWGTAHLVDSCVQAGVRRLIFASTTAVYGPGHGFDEQAPCRPLGPYAQSKHRAETAVLAGRERGLRPTILRLGSLFGAAPVTRFATAINRLAYLAGVGRSLTIHGRGTQRRPAIHVTDAADLIRFLLADAGDDHPTILNAVADNPSVVEVAETIRGQRPDVELRYTDQDVLTHLSLEVDNTDVLKTGWLPRLDVADGVADLLNRFRGLSQPGYTIE